MENYILSEYGTLNPKSISRIRKIKSVEYNHVFCCLRDDTIIEGRVNGVFMANNSFEIYGILMGKFFPFCIDSKSELFNSMEPTYGTHILLILKDVNFIVIDDDGFVINSPGFKEEPEGKYKENDTVLVKIKDYTKPAVIQKSGKLYGIPCHEVRLTVQPESSFIVLDKNVCGKLLDKHGLIYYLPDYLDLVPDDDIVNEHIGSKFRYMNYEGILQWKGKVCGLPCVGIEIENYRNASDFSCYTNKPGSYWCMVHYENKLEERGRKSRDLPIASNVKDENIRNGNKEGTQANKEIKNNSVYVDALPKMEMSETKHLTLQENSQRFLYTLVNSMFVFTTLFDNLITAGDNLCAFLNSEIVMPLRSHKNIDSDVWRKFSEQILKKYKSDRTDDLLVNLLKVIGFNFKICKNDAQNEDMLSIIDLSGIKVEAKLIDMMSLYCLNNEIWIFKPPKCLILGFKSGRNEDTNLPILSKLDISKLIITCANCCSVCSSKAKNICIDCSKDKKDITYFCQDHKTHCKHKKCDITCWENKDKADEGKVELELFSILCKNGSDYYAYIKTLDVNGNWTRFSVCDKGDCSVTEIGLQSYLDSKSNKEIDKKDIENIEKHMTFCIYKYPPLEFYWD